MVVLKKTVNIALAAFLILFTVVVKLSITRLCRAQYEDDDIAEANIVCRMVDYRNDNAANLGSDVDLTNGEAMRIDPRDRTLDRLTQKFRTLRLPAWINFSYSTIPHRARHTHRRRHIPFGPHGPQSSSFGRLGWLENAGNSGEALSPPPEPVFSKPMQASPIGEDQNPLAVDSLPCGPVSSHSPMVAWDDNSHVEVPYHNPYYTRAISDVLWLPRDPFGIVDLDETVDLRVSLTSEPNAGRLGEWHGHSPPPASPLPLPGSPLPTVFIPSISDTPDDRRSILVSSPGRQYTGREDIELPSGIASRVANLENEDDVEQTPRERRPSLFDRRNSSNKDRESIVSVRPQSRRKSTLDIQRPPPLNLRSSSISGEQDSRLAPSYAFASPSQQRARSTSTIMQIRPDAHAQAALAQSPLAPANLSQANLPQSSDHADVAQTRLVTTQEAVLHEVIAEEQEAAEERLRAEQVEADHANGKRSWLTSWIYAKVH